MHGGKTPRGIALPQTTHGRYSKYLPERLSERYHVALTDPELTAMREEIALVDTRVADLLTRIDTGEAGQLWRNARQAYEAVEDAAARGNKAQQALAFRRLGDVLGQGSADYAAWNELSSLLEQRRRLAESEQKRLVNAQLVVTVEDMTLAMTALLNSVRMHVEDRKKLAAIQEDYIRLTNYASVGAGQTKQRDENE